MNALAMFQALMNTIFGDVMRKFILVFFDNILVYSPDWESHMRHLTMVLELLQTHQVANRKRSSFGQILVEYLGHIISLEGVAMDPSKVQSVLQCLVPKNAKSVRGFLGLTGYYY